MVRDAMGGIARGCGVGAIVNGVQGCAVGAGIGGTAGVIFGALNGAADHCGSYM